jgi:hypothetical protein
MRTSSGMGRMLRPDRAEIEMQKHVAVSFTKDIAMAPFAAMLPLRPRPHPTVIAVLFEPLSGASPGRVVEAERCRDGIAPRWRRAPCRIRRESRSS